MPCDSWTIWNDATQEQMHGNIQQAIKWAEYLREQLPGGEVYCPGEHEGLFYEAWNKGLITSDLMLRQSRVIVRLCNVPLIMTNPKYSSGIRAEMDEANNAELPIICLHRIEQSEWPETIVNMVDMIHGFDANSLQWAGPE